MSHKTTKTPVPITKRDEDEDELLAVIRDAHTRLLALINRTDFQAFIGNDPATVSDALDAERLLYELRAGRAIATKGGRSPEELSIT